MEVFSEVEAERIRALRACDEFFWLDLEAPSDEELGALAGLLGLHQLALADSRNFDQEPKLDDYGDHLLIVFYSVRVAHEDPERRYRPLEVHLYVSGGFAVTIHRHPAPALVALHEPMCRHDPQRESTVVYQVLRALCDQFDEPLRDIAARVDRHEEQIFTRMRDERLETLYHLKQEIHELLRRMAVQHDMYRQMKAALMRLPGLTHDPTAELRDVRDQLGEIAGDLTRHHEDATTLVHLYFAAHQDRLTSLATRLTVLATFFLAWTLVTGFFGQNFKWLVDSLDSRTDFLLYGVGGLLVATLAAQLTVWLQRRGQKSP